MRVENLFNVFSEIKAQTLKVKDPSEDQLRKKLESGQYNLVIDQARYPLNSLSSIFESYNLHPEYQRNKVWDQSRKSKLIESLIINVPIPPIFLYEVEYNSFEVMDGLQRISTIIDFFNDKFTLKDLEVWSELNGKHYSELLPSFKSSIKRRYLSASIVLKESNIVDDKEFELKKIVFERLNTGGIKLSQQEIRNALDSGLTNKMINNVGDTNEKFLLTWNYPKKLNEIEREVDRMENREMVLRFFSYKDSLVNNARQGTQKTLDSYSSKIVKLGQDKTDELERYFLKVMNFVYDMFGDQAFNKKISSKSEKMIYDTVMLACSKIVDMNLTNTFLKNIKSQNENIILKNTFINDNPTLFNGKYTSLSKVFERQNVFYEFLLKHFGQE